jgi:spore coat polysaccharide biosynthesis protein SpsF
MQNEINLRVVLIVQARMGSTRLPAKVLKEVLEKPLLAYQIERLCQVKNAAQVMIATTTNLEDQAIVEFCRQAHVPLYRGSEDDVLDRYYQAAKALDADVVVRISGDCPLIDPAVVDFVINFYISHYPTYDYVSNTLERTYPRGMDVEVFSFKALEKAVQEACKKEEREHVTPYLYEHPELFNLGSVVRGPDVSQYRWTVDTDEDFDLISLILKALYPISPQFNMQDVFNLLKAHPEWSLINAGVQQKPVHEQSQEKE